MQLPYSDELCYNAPLNLEATLFCGQAFRWQKLSDHAFQGVVYGEIVRLTEVHHGRILIESTAPHLNHQSLPDFTRHYLGFEDNLNDLFSRSFIKKYPHLYRGASHYFGLRLLRQEPFETLISFMCAQGIGVALIRRQVLLLSQNFGRFITITEYKFPAPNALAHADLSRLAQCTNNNLIRARNIQRVAQAVADGDLDLSALSAPHCDFETARASLLRYHGIGDKIADCVCLFGLGHRSAFPIDTHVRQYLSAWFGISTKSVSLTSTEYQRLCREARAILGEVNTGLAGQLLFHYWRKDIKAMKSF